MKVLISLVLIGAGVLAAGIGCALFEQGFADGLLGIGLGAFVATFAFYL